VPIFRVHCDDGNTIDVTARHVHIFEEAALFHDDDDADANLMGESKLIKAIVPFTSIFLIENLEGDDE
jgi:hypothetical protein